MEYQKMINLLDNTPNHLSKFRRKNWVETDDDLRGTYNTNSQIKFKTSRLKSSLCDYSDACILVKGTITVAGAERPLPPGAQARAQQQLLRAREDDKRNKGVIFKTCAPLIDFISEINNTQIDNG